MSEIIFNDQQEAAIHKVLDWFEKHQRIATPKDWFFLSGYAGTGKTTLAKYIAQQVGGMDKVAFIAPTGKAAARLRAKGCYTAKTVHQFAFRYLGDDADEDPMFVAKGSIDEKPKLIILDEAVMNGQRAMDAILSHNIATLGLGDIGQLPPVKDKAFFHEGNVDVLLDQIERNAGNIVKASMFLRQGKRLPIREYDDVAVRAQLPSDDELMALTGEDAVILCAYNTTRESINDRIRNLQGHTSRMPKIGEKLVCTFNQHSHRLMNGEQVILLELREPASHEAEAFHPDAPDEMMIARVKNLSDGREHLCAFNPLSFSDDATTRIAAQKRHGGFDYGGCLTVHKAQGSEWERVGVIEETLRNMPYEKIMYTAATRAISRLEVYRA
ncbi:RecD [Burkholderia phage BcepF1]|uniref:RecD n=1 Tax=Burkholderia phage BcepF1 TaxID=2886897 RepID=A1YZX5_9CAUD|nr:Dda-like helicase [Burkholderia phage BcepF1]ABL96802.1 RecD [Burkholderia phage BcepF1]